jgi:hypothetical protein
VTPYDEAQVTAFIDDVEQAYRDASQEWNVYSAVWVARMQFDAIALGYPAARDKQLTALKQQLAGQEPGPEPGPEPIPPGQFVQSPREWVGQMGGVHVAGLPAIYWGPPDPTMVLSWLYDRYEPEWRAKIRAAWKARGYTHVMLSWPDARAFNPDPMRFRNMVVELLNDGFWPGVMWCSKDFDPSDVDQILAGIEPAVQQLIGVLPIACIGWELSLWLTPTQVQELIDAIAPRFVAYGCRVYVHFQQGYSSYQQEDHFFHHFWDLQVGKLTGTLHQRILGTTSQEYREASGGLQDVLERFAGNFGCPSDSGFGHPFDLLAWEVSCADQFNGNTSETQGDALGTWALRTPRSTGSAGVVGVMGVGNGRLDDAAAVVTSFTVRPRINWRATAGPLIDLNARAKHTRVVP